ncbi:MAG: hypothetical protein ABSA13_12940 [Beijerinckiaceae bacterium]|jgi:hypothetical protein
MRLSDQEFERLFSLQDFTEYYDNLTVAEVMGELERLRTDGPVTRILFQNCAIHRRLTDAASFDCELTEQQRSSVIGVVTGMRETIEKLVLPYVDADMQERVRAALKGTDDYIDRFGTFPRAVFMIQVGARKPCGPYEMGTIGQLLTKS